MKILVLKRDKIGDLLLSTPLLARLKAAAPRVETHLLANDYNAWVAAGNPHVDRVWVYRRVRDGGRIRIGAAWDWFWQKRALRRERFDWVIVANGDESPRAIRRGLSLRGVRTVARCADASKFPGLTDPLPQDPGSHEIDRLLGLLAPLQFPAGGVAAFPSYVLPAASEAFATRWLSEQGLTQRQYIVIGLGARRAKKRPSSAQILRWSAHFKQRWGLDTVLMWTPGKAGDPRYPGDDALARPLIDAEARGLAPQLHPFRGPIAGALGLVWAARTSLFPDSGLMHFAAASPGGVLGFFADTGVSPAPAQWAPRGAKAAWVEAPQCVGELPDERVYDQVERLLSP